MYTFGHGELDHDALAGLLTTAGITGVVDVRRFPGSRHNEAAARGQVEALAEELDIAYRHDVRLGGRRSLSKEEDLDSPDTWWEVNHLMHSGHFHQHEPSQGARIVDGHVVWDGHPQG